MGIYLVAQALVKCFVLEEGNYHNIDYQGLMIGWFLPVLFAIEMISFYIDSVFKNKVCLLLILLCSSVLFYFCEIQSFIYLQQLFAGFVFSYSVFFYVLFLTSLNRANVMPASLC